jgi:hypothetical protein
MAGLDRHASFFRDGTGRLRPQAWGVAKAPKTPLLFSHFLDADQF